MPRSYVNPRQTLARDRTTRGAPAKRKDDGWDISQWVSAFFSDWTPRSASAGTRAPPLAFGHRHRLSAHSAMTAPYGS